MNSSCKDFVLQYNESRGEIFELAHATLVHGSGSEVLDWVTAMEGEDSEQPEDTLEQEPVEQDFCLESIQFTAPLLHFFAGGTGRWDFGVLAKFLVWIPDPS